MRALKILPIALFLLPSIVYCMMIIVKYAINNSDKKEINLEELKIKVYEAIVNINSIIYCAIFWIILICSYIYFH